jgi:hypothetical protein
VNIPQGALHPFFDLLGGKFAYLEPVSDVFVHRHVGEHGIVLKDHARIPQIRRNIIDQFPAQPDIALILPVKPRDGSQQGGLAAT